MFRLVTSRPTAPPAAYDWTQADLAECFRCADILARHGVPVEIDRGLTDEGDPWIVLVAPAREEVVLHAARIDGKVVVVSEALAIRASGFTLREALRTCLEDERFRLCLSSTAQLSASGPVLLHPVTILVALVLLSYVAAGEAQASESGGAARDAVLSRVQHVAESIGLERPWDERDAPVPPGGRADERGDSDVVRLPATGSPLTWRGGIDAAILGAVFASLQQSSFTMTDVAAPVPPTPATEASWDAPSPDAVLAFAPPAPVAPPAEASRGSVAPGPADTHGSDTLPRLLDASSTADTMTHADGLAGAPAAPLAAAPSSDAAPAPTADEVPAVATERMVAVDVVEFQVAAREPLLDEAAREMIAWIQAGLTQEDTRATEGRAAASERQADVVQGEVVQFIDFRRAAEKSSKILQDLQDFVGWLDEAENAIVLAAPQLAGTQAVTEFVFGREHSLQKIIVVEDGETTMSPYRLTHDIGLMSVDYLLVGTTQAPPMQAAQPLLLGLPVVGDVLAVAWISLS